MDQLRIKAEHLAESMRLPDHRRTFIIGSFDFRVSFLSQQVRALNLVWALTVLDRIKKGTKVAVVGGGVAGLAAAAAAAGRGADVTLIEAEQYCHEQKGNAERYVHPYILHWPFEIADRTSTDLPFMNWEAGSAQRVIQQILDGWAICDKRVTPVKSVTVESFEESVYAESVRLVGIRSNSKRSEPSTWNEKFDIAILAVGFGQESTIGAAPLSPYWTHDNLHRERAHGQTRSYLVTGCGDGALIDALRLTIEDFSHESFVRRFLDDRTPEFVEFRRNLVEIERQVYELRLSPLQIGDLYKNLRIPTRLRETLSAERKDDFEVTLNGPSEVFYHLRASPLNRVAIHLQMDAGAVRWKSGRIDDVVPNGTRYGVIIKGKLAFSVDRIIPRHGPSGPALVPPELANRLRAVRDKTPGADALARHWPPDFYRPCADRTGNRSLRRDRRSRRDDTRAKRKRQVISGKAKVTNEAVRGIEEFQAEFIAQDYKLPPGTRPVVTPQAEKALVRRLARERTSATEMSLKILRQAILHARVKKKGNTVAVKVGKEAIEKSLRSKGLA